MTKRVGNFEISVSTYGWPPQITLKQRNGNDDEWKEEFIHLTGDDLKDLEYAARFGIDKLKHGDQ